MNTDFSLSNELVTHHATYDLSSIKAVIQYYGIEYSLHQVYLMEEADRNVTVTYTDDASLNHTINIMLNALEAFSDIRFFR